MLLVRVSISIPEQFPPSGEWRRKKQRGQFVIISISGDMPPTPQPFLCPRLDVYILNIDCKFKKYPLSFDLFIRDSVVIFKPSNFIQRIRGKQNVK